MPTLCMEFGILMESLIAVLGIHAFAHTAECCGVLSLVALQHQCGCGMAFAAILAVVAMGFGLLLELRPSAWGCMPSPTVHDARVGACIG